MKFSLFQDTRVGKRPYNQDRIGHWKTAEAAFLVVADGMGGHAHGEIAAQVTVDVLGAAFRAEAKPRLVDPDRFLATGVSRAHAMILHQAQKQGLADNPSDSPRTTVVACVLQGGYAHWSFIGDSRLYLIREGRIVTRTRDHTPVQMLIDAGALALSKDISAQEFQPAVGYGTIADAPAKDMAVVACSQEHGFVGAGDPLPYGNLPIGTRVRVLPNHACITAAAYDRYYVVDSELDGGRTVVDIYDRINGW